VNIIAYNYAFIDF